MKLARTKKEEKRVRKPEQEPLQLEREKKTIELPELTKKSTPTSTDQNSRQSRFQSAKQRCIYLCD